MSDTCEVRDSKDSPSLRPDIEPLSVRGKSASRGESKLTEMLPETLRARDSSKLNDFQWRIGEGLVTRLGSEKLDLTPDPRFDQTRKSFDEVFVGNDRKPVIVEAKFTEKGIHSLKDNQMQPGWVRGTAIKMQNPGAGDYYTPGNAEIGAGIERIGAENIQRLVIAIHPDSLVTKCYQGNPDGSWNPLAEWDVMKLEQPTLKK